MIVHDPAAHHTPTPSQLETWDASRRQDIAHQLARLEQRRAEDRATATTATTATSSSTTTKATATPAQDATLAAAIQKKRAEREARRRQLATVTAAAAPTEAEADATGAGAAIQGSEERDAPASNAVYTVSVPTTSDKFAWYDYNDDAASSQRHTYETLDAARAARVWSFPSSAEERVRCEVFRDLWEKGYYMGGGSKFGGDWLVYPGARFYFSLLLVTLLLTLVYMRAADTGDPMRYHSHFVASVQASPSAPLRPMEVVAHGRLGTATKKAHLLCSWDHASREVTYITIEWAGFG